MSRILFLFQKWACRVRKGWHGFSLGYVPQVWPDIVSDFLELGCPELEIHQVKIKAGCLRLCVGTKPKLLIPDERIRAELLSLERVLQTPQYLRNMRAAHGARFAAQKKRRKTGAGMMVVGIDFETANHFRVSNCAAGMAVFVDGVLTEAPYWLVQPAVDNSCGILNANRNEREGREGPIDSVGPLRCHHPFSFGEPRKPTLVCLRTACVHAGARATISHQ